MIRIAAVSAALLFALPAFAADEPRKIDFTVNMVDQDGEVLMECAENPPPAKAEECKAKRPVTLGMVAMRAVAAQEQGLAPEESLKRGQLALSIYKSPAAQLTAEEVALIKKQVAKFYAPLLVVRAFAILDPGAK